MVRVDFLPFYISQKIDKDIPELSIQLVDSLGWQWAFRCQESKDYFNTWAEALLDFAVFQSDAIDDAMGFFEE